VLERATSEVVLVGIIAKAAPTNWRAAAWLLERRDPDEIVDRVQQKTGQPREQVEQRVQKVMQQR
jgi:hypothetical protein